MDAIKEAKECESGYAWTEVHGYTSTGHCIARVVAVRQTTRSPNSMILELFSHVWKPEHRRSVEAEWNTERKRYEINPWTYCGPVQVINDSVETLHEPVYPKVKIYIAGVFEHTSSLVFVSLTQRNGLVAFVGVPCEDDADLGELPFEWNDERDRFEMNPEFYLVIDGCNGRDETLKWLSEQRFGGSVCRKFGDRLLYWCCARQGPRVQVYRS